MSVETVDAEQRGVRGRRLRFDPWKVALAVVLTAAVLVVLGWVLLGSRLLVVRQVQVTGERLVAGTQVVAASGVRLGAPLVKVDRAAVARRVEAIRQVESARVERRWPSTLRIAVTERTPVAAHRRDTGYDLLDRAGVVVTTVDRRPRSLPLVELANPGPEDASTRAALAVVGSLPHTLVAKIAKVTASRPTEVTVHLRDGAVAVWGGPEKSAAKARTLLVLMKRDADVYDVSSPEVATTR